MVGLGIAGFVLQGLALAIGGVWKFTQMEQRITGTISQHRKEIDEEHTSAIEALRRECGESVAAIRQKVHEIETWSRDHFVRRDSFEVVVREIRDAISAQGANLDKRLDRIDAKLDRT